MKPFLSLASLLALLIPLSAQAGVVVEDRETDDGRLTVYHMTVTPAPEPVPALKYRLWLRPQDQQPGNSVVHYLRAFAEGGLTKDFENAQKEFGDEMYEWASNGVPMEKLPLEKVRKLTAMFDKRIQEMIQPGTRCRDCDWGWDVLRLQGPGVFSYLLPDMQAMRTVSRSISLRTRLAIAEHRYDDAIEGMRMNYRVGHDVGENPLLVCSLVGIAIQGSANNNVIDIVATLDSPNLYWALAELPTPLVNMQNAIRVEMGLGLRVFPPLLDAETAEHSPTEWAQLLREGVKDFTGFTNGSEFGEPEAAAQGLALTGLSMATYPAARQRLLASGMSPEAVEKMPVGQVILVDISREYRRIANDWEKWWNVPYQEAKKGEDFEVAALQQEDTTNLGRTMASLLLPAVNAARSAQMRAEWQLKALEVIEALRMHAAVEGKFPSSLDEIDVVPVPVNPITLQRFVYHLKDGMAVLELPFSDGMPGIAWRFEIKLAEKSKEK